MNRIGIFGGTFDPPHIAHSILANEVREQMNLDKIIFVPSGNPPLKDNDIVSSHMHRLNMAKIAFERDKSFEINDMEIKKYYEKSFTIDTVEKLAEEYKNDPVKLYLIIGIDNLIDFPKWKEPDKIFSICEVLVMYRPGYIVKKITPEYSSKVKYIDVPLLEISSTSIRNKVKNKESIKYLVFPEVENYILNNKLYL
ncbi:nicotinate-nucleotide adenylyltransferase [Bacteroidota bacterium]